MECNFPRLLCTSHLISSACGAGVVAKQAKDNKNLSIVLFQPESQNVTVTIETSAVFGLNTYVFCPTLADTSKWLLLSLKHTCIMVYCRVSVLVQLVDCIAASRCLSNLYLAWIACSFVHQFSCCLKRSCIVYLSCFVLVFVQYTINCFCCFPVCFLFIVLFLLLLLLMTVHIKINNNYCCFY